ncbi:MAG: aromatic ring-hydroxylating dioxygenase subunit alpha [Hydrotalea sp. AMD]|uniref:aromatic ring-hydroxylating oxygenase subunit alpha n=1 Tax=Hydrotalea TaxID=1004300 RepID=UPI0010280A90|nr:MULTISPECIES: aromatic ring-hydroxylating dioxygenase subunit alpha [Hydrotalea]RWZ87567.1 MAG: aromatic ring-hydroxylating dioxygenase subunit alpha [Hydrotalea sp. AMD]
MSSLFVHPDIAVARTIATDFYLDPYYFEASKDSIFAPSWQWIGDTGRLDANTTVYPFTLLPEYLEEPLVLTRDQQNQYHCLSNVCNHRGNIIAQTPCNAKHLRCNYHGRLFQLDGRFISMPEFEGVQNFIPENNHLPELPLFQWGNLLFTRLMPGLPATAYFGDMMQRVNWLPLQHMEYRPDLSATYQVQAHWALYCENYLEGFHIPFVHPQLNAILNFKDYTTELFSLSNLQLGIAKAGDVCFDIPPNAPDVGKQIAAYYFWVYPNMMFNFYPWGLSLNIIEPQSPDQTTVRFITYVYDADKLGSGAGSGLDTVEQEDEAVVQLVQKGIRSRFYQHGRYSVLLEQGTHHFHRLLAQSLTPTNG